MNYDRLTTQTLNRIRRNQQKYIRELEDLLESGKTLTPKTVKTKIRRAKERLADFEKEALKEVKEGIEKAYSGALNGVSKELGINLNIDAISPRELEELEEFGSWYMHNYSDDVIKRVQMQLQVSMLNGESVSDAYERIKPIGNAVARPRVMIRDQVSLARQRAITSAYGATGHPQDFDYYWEGPDDERRTVICAERVEGNPYTWEEVQKMSPHPHIQCRHRWRAVLKVKPSKEEATAFKKKKFKPDFSQKKVTPVRLINSLDEQFRDVVWKMPNSDKARQVVQKYTGETYEEINEALRAGSKVSKDAEVLAEVIDSTSIKNNMMSWRATNNPTLDDLIENHGIDKVVGKTFKDEAFVSTSLDRNVVLEKFIKDPLYVNKYFFTIEIPKNSKGLFVKSVSNFEEEMELLLQKGTIFEVQSVKKSTAFNGYDIVLRVVGVE